MEVQVTQWLLLCWSLFEVSPRRKTADEPHCASLSLVVCTHITVLWSSNSAFAPELDLRTSDKTSPVCSTSCSMLLFISLKYHSSIKHMSNRNKIISAYPHIYEQGQDFILFHVCSMEEVPIYKRFIFTFHLKYSYH